MKKTKVSKVNQKQLSIPKEEFDDVVKTLLQTPPNTKKGSSSVKK